MRKVSLATAARILQAEINVVRALSAHSAWSGRLADPSSTSVEIATCTARIRPRISVLSRIKTRRTSHENSISSWRAATRLRGEKAPGESLPSDDGQFGATERNRLKREFFGSSISVQTLPGRPLAKVRPVGGASAKPGRGHLKNRLTGCFARGRKLSFNKTCGRLSR
jgi:hypothetical protein